MKEKLFLKPAKDNREARLNFIKYWAEYVRTHSDEDWSEQQNIIIDSQFQHEQFSLNLESLSFFQRV